ncbi:MAG: hypothetical protein GKR90_22600 [Pseudomonadales bacterium]|nr:hypothetical protein [Pseudomonadales bacterium]
MNWTKASAIAEITSSIAILVTLIYLAIEIGQNAEATNAEVRQSILASDQQFLEMIVADPRLNLMWYQSELSPEERTRLSFFLLTHMRMRENNWLQYQSGVLDTDTWNTYRSSLIVVLSTPQPRKWWENFNVERQFDPGFIDQVNKLIAGNPIVEKSPHVAVFD